MKQSAAVWADVLDNRGQRVAVLSPIVGGVAQPTLIDGPIQGADFSSYTPTGAGLDKIPNVVFRVPMSERRNVALDVGSQIAVYERNLAGKVAQAIITDFSEAPSADGFWANFTCPALPYELSQVTTGSGVVFGAADTMQARLSAVVSRNWIPPNLSDTPWIATYNPPDPTQPTQYDGMAFSAYFTTISECVGKMAKDTGTHWRQDTANDGRSIIMGPFGGVLGLHLQRGGRMAGRTAQNVNARQIMKVTPSRDGKVVNTVIPTGAGNGITQLTLRELFDQKTQQMVPQFTSGAIPGYNPQYQIGYRRRQDNGGADGFEYLLLDATSQGKYRIIESGFNRSDIGYISNAPTDRILGAASLYIAAVAFLQQKAYPSDTLTVTTVHAPGMDNRGYAGQRVHVQWAETNRAGVLTLNINSDYVVMDVTTRITDGRMYDDWILSSIGQYKETAATIITGALQALDNMKVQPQIYPTDFPVWAAEDIGPSGDMTIHIPGGSHIVRAVSALFNFYLQPVRHTVGDTLDSPHAHAYDVGAQGHVPPSQGIITPTHQHAPPSGLTSQAIFSKSGQLFDPSPSLRFEPGTGNGHALYEPNTGDAWIEASGGVSKSINLARSLLSWTDIQHTHQVTGDAAGKITDNNSGDIKANQNISTVAPTSATLTTSGFIRTAATGTAATTNTSTVNGVVTAGGNHIHANNYVMVLGPAPTGVSVYMDNVQIPVLGPFSTDQLGIDFVTKGYFNDQADHTMLIKSATLGRVQVAGNVRRHATTVV